MLHVVATLVVFMGLLALALHGWEQDDGTGAKAQTLHYAVPLVSVGVLLLASAWGLAFARPDED